MLVMGAIDFNLIHNKIMVFCLGKHTVHNPDSIHPITIQHCTFSISGYIEIELSFSKQLYPCCCSAYTQGPIVILLTSDEYKYAIQMLHSDKHATDLEQDVSPVSIQELFC